MPLPLGRNARTLTTTFTFPPPAAGLWKATGPLVGTTTLSRDRNDGLDAVDCIGVVDAIDVLVAAVLELRADILDIEAEDECEAVLRWL